MESLDVEQSEELRRLYQEARRLIAGTNMKSTKTASHDEQLLQRPVNNYRRTLFRSYDLPFNECDEESALKNIKSRLQNMHERIDKQGKLLRIAKAISLIEGPFLGQRVCNKLPPELRDQVYSHLWQEGEIDALNAHIESPHRREEINKNKKPWKLPVPMFANAAFVGNTFAGEVASWYFHSAMTAEIDYDMVPAFLCIQEFGSQAFRPIDCLRTLTISINWELQDYLDFDIKEIKPCMDSLLAFPWRPDFEIKIYLSRDLQFSRRLFEILELMRPSYKALVEKGVKIKILGFRFFTPKWRFEEPVRPTCTTSEVLNHYYDATPEHWLVMKTREITADEQPERRRKCEEILNNMRNNLQDMKREAALSSPPFFDSELLTSLDGVTFKDTSRNEEIRQPFFF